MNEDIMKKAGFKDEVDRIKQGLCPLCEKKASLEDFRDMISKGEYAISGLCQGCQDSIFNELPELPEPVQDEMSLEQRMAEDEAADEIAF